MYTTTARAFQIRPRPQQLRCAVPRRAARVTDGRASPTHVLGGTMKQRNLPRGISGRAFEGGSDDEKTPLMAETKDDKEEELGGGSDEGAGGDGALEPGGEVDVFAFHRCGYLAQYFVVGLMNASISSMGYGLYICYLNVPAYVNASQSSLIQMAWSLKVLFALISDACPIGGYRRKPYMALGWTIAAVMLSAVALTPLPDPYYCKDASGNYDTHRVCNKEAAHSGTLYAALLSIATCGMMFADVCADALTVQYARREPLKRRGSTQTLAYLTRECGSVVASLLVGFGMNGKEYNGSFERGLSFNFICGLLACAVMAQIPISLYLIDEPPLKLDGKPPVTIASACGKMGTMLESGATFDYIMYAQRSPRLPLFVPAALSPHAALPLSPQPPPRRRR